MIFMAVITAEPTWAVVSKREVFPPATATYEGKQVRKVVPPKIGARQDPCGDSEHHGDDSQSDKDRVERDEATVGPDRVITHVRGEVPGGCLISACVQPLNRCIPLFGQAYRETP